MPTCRQLPGCLVTLVLLAVLSACASTPEPASTDSQALAAWSATPAGGDATGVVPAQPVLESPTMDVAANTSPVDTATAAADDTRNPVPDTAADIRSQPTQAELDFAAIYGGEVDYQPIADPNLPPPAELPTSYDPWEPLNRRMHRFNEVIDENIAKPLAEAYLATVPRPVRVAVSNFFRNLGQPVSALNSLLQGKPKAAGQSLARFTLNISLGLAGILDPASAIGLPTHDEDFGQTLGVWGWERSRYVELPLFGPRTVRDVFGLVGDAPLSPVRGIEQDKTRVFLQGLQLVDVRTQLLSIDSMLEGAPDEYALLRDAWLQRRNYQIQGARQDDEEWLPEYLRDDYNPTVPVDAFPVLPPDGG